MLFQTCNRYNFDKKACGVVAWKILGGIAMWFAVENTILCGRKVLIPDDLNVRQLIREVAHGPARFPVMTSHDGCDNWKEFNILALILSILSA